VTVAERMFGIETEYSLSLLGPAGARVEQDRAITRFMDAARRTLAYLPDASTRGMFLQNGSRLYIDCGHHPELAICEVVNPWDICRYVLAGERMLTAVAEQAAAEDCGLREIFLTRCNVCYSPRRPTTWGCHESYAHRVPPPQLCAQLVPHLVSRIIYTGAGGFNNQFPGIQFMISPRVAHLEQVASDASTSSRGIYHNKNESLNSSGYHRLHVLCGESVCSQVSLWLKTAVTALVVAMIEAGLEPCAAIQLCDPLGAMERFAVDTELRATARSPDGRSWTALEMQRHILRKIEDHAGHRLMPAWTPQVIARLRQVLDRLERGPAAVAKTLDWAIKLALFQELAQRRGIPWESLAARNERLPRRRARPPRVAPSDHVRSLVHLLLEGASAAVDDSPPPAGGPEQESSDREESPAVLALRQELFALDTRFGQLGRQGVFAALDQAGVLEHGVAGVDNIEHAIAHPPATGRARLRGDCVRRFHPQHDRFVCDWTSIWDQERRQYLDLSDPFVSEEHWRHEPAEPPPSSRGIAEILQRMLADARRFYHRGRFEHAYRCLEHVRAMQECFNAHDRSEMLRLRAWVLCRRGFLDGLPILDNLARDLGESLWLTTDYLCCYRFGGLTPRPETAHWIERGRDQLRRQPEQPLDRILCFREHEGYFLMSQGRLDEARDVLQSACGTPREGLPNGRVLWRAMAVLGEVHRRLGRHSEAVRLLDTAMSEQGANDFPGDQAGFSWAYLAKLQAGSPLARRTLDQAKAVQLDIQDRMGEARTLLLEARLADDPGATAPIKGRILELKEQLPALGQCRLLAKILDRWDAWTSGVLAADESGDVFWGV
jgi:proteasome accessory factor A